MAGETRDCMAEREGFEPPIPVKVWPLSRRLVSTTHAPLRARLHLAEVDQHIQFSKMRRQGWLWAHAIRSSSAGIFLASLAEERLQQLHAARGQDSRS